MSASKHTPGPWRDCAPGSNFAKGRRFIRPRESDSLIATVSGELPTSERWANARLIAAAPDLLAALREWQAFRDSPSVLQGTSHAAHMALCEFTNKVNAAIAKAEGGAR